MRWLLVWALVSLGLLSFVAGELNCSYDPSAYITTAQDVRWSCWNDGFADAKCYSLVYFGDDVLTVYPEIKYVDGVGMVDYFSASNGLVNVYFKTTDLYERYNYTFQVVCGEVGGSRTTSFARSVMLVDRDLDELPYRAIWFKDNTSYIIGFGALLLVAAIVIAFVRRF